MLILVVTGIAGCAGFIAAERLPPDAREVTEYDNTLADRNSSDESDVPNQWPSPAMNVD